MSNPNDTLTQTLGMRMHELCTMHNVPSNQNALEATCRHTTNASYALTHHVPMQFNKPKCSSMHEHVLGYAKCMSLWLKCKVNLNAFMLCMKIFTPTPITMQNPIQNKKFKHEGSRIKMYVEFASNDSVQFQEKLKSEKQLKISAYLNLTLT